MNNEEICIILNQYHYENRSDWYYHMRNDSYLSLTSTSEQGLTDIRCIELPESAAIAVCEKLIKTSSDDDIKAIVLSIIKPYKDKIEELQKELVTLRYVVSCASEPIRISAFPTVQDLEDQDTA